MTAILDQVPLERISEQARQVRFAESLLRLIAFLLIGSGKLLGLAWLVPVWCFLAVREGWREVHPPEARQERRPR